MKKILTFTMVALIFLSATACSNTNKMIEGEFQKGITKVDRFSDNNIDIIDFKQRALNYDQLVFDYNSTGTYFPLMWEDNTNDSFGISAYVGDYRNNQDGTQEAVTLLASIISGSKVGIDKSNQKGVNYVKKIIPFFSDEEQIVLNNFNGSSESTSLWYLIYPAILYTEISILYENELVLRDKVLANIESWYKAYLIFNEKKDYNYSHFNFKTMTPYKNNIWTEPDSSAGISQLMYYGYKLTNDTKYKDAAINSLKYLEETYNGSSMYEILLYYAPYLGALYNEEFNTNFNVGRHFNSIFNGGSNVRGGWGMISETWNHYNMQGLMGSISDGGGYAFSMNTFSSAYIMAKTVKYDHRYADAMGKWLLNLISNSRYFFSDYSNKDNQSLYNSTNAIKAQEFNEIANHNIPYEGIRKFGNSVTPWFGGDPTVYDWAETDYSLYSGASMGMLASLYEETNVNNVLKIDLNQGDYFNSKYKQYLIYNPNKEEVKIEYNFNSNDFKLYDSIKQEYIKVTNNTISINKESSIIVTEIPSNSEITNNLTNISIEDTVISNKLISINIANYNNNDQVKKDKTIIVNSKFNNELINEEIEYYEVIVNKVATKYYSNKIKLKDLKGTVNVTVNVKTKNGLTDTITIRLSF